MKLEKASKEALQPHIDQLVTLKKKLDEIIVAESKKEFDRTKLETVLRRRFFYAPAFDIYGGVSGLYDYGPPGCALQANILQLWRSHFILEEQMLEVDTTILTPYDVLHTSGHVDRFTDLMVKDKGNGNLYRADHLLENWLSAQIKDVKTDAKLKEEYSYVMTQVDNYDAKELGDILRKYNVKAPESGNDISEPEPFNLMFKTQIGPAEHDSKGRGFMRPETAQGQFTNFKKLYEYNNERMPFASAQIGKSFRNEISPRAGLLRVREFTMAEIEHYVHPNKKDHPRFREVENVIMSFLPASEQEKGVSSTIDMTIGEAVRSGMVNNETLGYFLARISLFLIKIGIKKERLRFRQHMSNEMAHYASDCWDAEIQSSYGWIECVGCADRSAYDLSNHTKRTGERLVAREKLDTPIQKNVIKPQFNKKEIGVKFKKDAKVIVDEIENMNECELKELKKSLETNQRAKVAGFEVSSDMVSIVETVETCYVDEYIPSVIEPSFGIGRIMYSLLEHSYYVRENDENRCVLSFPPVVAPVKCLVVPLSGHPSFPPFIYELCQLLRSKDISFQKDDSSSSVGKRYARNDEIGIPFGITVDFQTVKDKTVTLRERDSMSQVRIHMDQVANIVASLANATLSWNKVTETFPAFVEQEIDN
ncbi:glycyl-tRNA synthetase 1 [Rozella allomycis CSF55]|uniref:glycine--tRNA ligase n=1 Tax=Rozella allomycis (strain CSF55) TaxID=988480 RepID=A0A4V1J0N6_ROZAC|nr:glycyl-tRNA synthetase 1 [Rozella allomycis CSF55]